MRILHVGKYYAPERGGIERYLEAVAGWFVERGDAVAAVVHQAPGEWRSNEETRAGVAVTRVGCLAAPVYTPVSPTFPLKLARAIARFRPEILHLHVPNPSCFSALALPSARRIPWIVHWHSDIPADAPDWRLRLGYRAYRPFEQALLARADAVVATSRPYLEASAALARWKDKVRVIPLGLDDAPKAQPQPAFWPAAKDALRVLAVGRLSHYKGFDVLVEALSMTADASLVIVGTGECDEKLRSTIDALGLGERIRLAGNLDDAALASAYAAADVVALPSLNRGEAFGLVLLEAMRAGRAVVASDVPGSGIGAVVGQDETGLLVPPGDAGALATAINRLRDGTRRARFGEAGRRRWAAHFTLEKSAGAIRALYRSVLR